MMIRHAQVGEALEVAGYVKVGKVRGNAVLLDKKMPPSYKRLVHNW